LRNRISKILFALSSIFRACGKFICKDTTILVAVLPLPGWFILDECIIHQTPLYGKLIGFEWKYWPMPDDWCKEMNILKRKVKK